ncbi:hypothetical protein GA0115252_12263 [Streptomyces sp. DfronAA-171]|nr:hypothetical protein GA0115252_12263 [Streptomyces sp. DfronAA-171]
MRPSSPPGRSAGSATSAPSAGAITVLVPSACVMTPAWRSVLPVGTTELPILMTPLDELEEIQVAWSSIPSAASIAALSTGQRSNGAQRPFSCGPAAVDVPMDAIVAKAAVALSTVRRLRELIPVSLRSRATRARTLLTGNLARQ